MEQVTWRPLLDRAAYDLDRSEGRVGTSIVRSIMRGMTYTLTSQVKYNMFGLQRGAQQPR